MVSLPAVQGLISVGQPTCLVARSSLQEELASRIPGLAGCVSEREFSNMPLSEGDVYYNLRKHPLQENYWWGSLEFERDYPRHRINDILATITRDMGIMADFTKLSPLPHQHRQEARDRIVLIPGADGSYKFWPAQHWYRLYEDLVKTVGTYPLILGEPENPAVRELAESGLAWIPTPSITDALDLISSARAVIALDTGLMHIAVHQGVPTIGLFRNRAIYTRPYPHTFALEAGPCHPDCLDAYRSCSNNIWVNLVDCPLKTWDCQATEQERCMTSILPDAILSIVSKHPTLFLNQGTR